HADPAPKACREHAASFYCECRRGDQDDIESHQRICFAVQNGQGFIEEVEHLLLLFELLRGQLAHDVDKIGPHRSLLVRYDAMRYRDTDRIAFSPDAAAGLPPRRALSTRFHGS